MKVRDKTLENSEYKGQVIDASKSICPCMPCFNPHDCGRYIYTGVNQKEWQVDMRCATRHNNGCPRPLEKAKHIYSKRGRICKRCGFRKAEKSNQSDKTMTPNEVKEKYFPSDCRYPDHEGNMITGKHRFRDGFCIICGEKSDKEDASDEG